MPKWAPFDSFCGDRLDHVPRQRKSYALADISISDLKDRQSSDLQLHVFGAPLAKPTPRLPSAGDSNPQQTSISADCKQTNTMTKAPKDRAIQIIPREFRGVVHTIDIAIIPEEPEVFGLSFLYYLLSSPRTVPLRALGCQIIPCPVQHKISLRRGRNKRPLDFALRLHFS